MSVPLEDLASVNGGLSVLKLWGKVEGTFYVDDMKLVAEVQPPTSVAASLEPSEWLQGYVLYPNVPNPFNAHTRITYELPLSSEVKLSVYDLLGQKVCILEEGFRTAGSHTVIWNGRSEQGQEVASGIYLLHWEAGTFSQTDRMVLIR